MTSVEMSTPGDLQRRRELQRHAEDERPDQHPERAPAGEHADHDRDVALALGHEGHEDARARDREVAAAEARERAGRDDRQAARGHHAHARRVERLRPLAGRAQVEAGPRAPQQPGRERDQPTPR